jgi:transcriptional regulator with XRE-family HTH domain
MNDLVSRNIRRFRAERDLSLGELARRAEVSKQTLSKIEQGQGNPTVETVESIGRALGVSFRRLVTEWGTRSHVSRAAEAQWVSTSTGQSRHLDQIYGSGYVRTQMVVVEGGESHVVPAHGPGTLHQIYVVEGQVEAGPQNEVRTLGVGDFMRFPGDVEHVYRCLGNRAVAHLTTTAPQVPQFSPDFGQGPDAGWPA